jgi:hypothetical protein
VTRPLTEEEDGLSDAEAWELARQIEEMGPEDVVAVLHRPGRPRLRGTATGRSPRVTTRLPESLLERYRDSARRRRTSVSAEVRRVLTEHPPER